MVKWLVVLVPLDLHRRVTIRHQLTLKVGGVILLQSGQVLDLGAEFRGAFLVLVVQILLGGGLSLPPNEFTHR